MGSKKRLYFIIGMNTEQSYIYKYYLAINRDEARIIFNNNHEGYEIVEIKTISPSKKLIAEYEKIIKEKKR